jgi:hypothetical protein
MDISRSRERLDEGKQMVDVPSSTCTSTTSTDLDIHGGVALALDKLNSKIDELEGKLEVIRNTIALTVRCYELLNQVRSWISSVTVYPLAVGQMCQLHLWAFSK